MAFTLQIRDRAPHFELPATDGKTRSGPASSPSHRVPLTDPIGCNVKQEPQDRHWMPAEACDLV